MVDNWSASPVTLTDPGDWAKWTMDVPDSTTRDQLNGSSLATLSAAQIRGARPAASLNAYGMLIINDRLAEALTWLPSTSSWISADRFQSVAFGGPGRAAQGFPEPSPGIFVGSSFSDGAFVVGTNTIRLLWYGVGTTGAAQAFELDLAFFVANGTKAGSPDDYDFGDDDHAEPKPSDYDTHVNPDPTIADLSPKKVWLLKAGEATTGHAEAAKFALIKLCPTTGTLFHVRFKFMYPDGSPASGEVGMADLGGGGSPTYLTLDANGRIDVENVESDAGGTNFWFTGNDDLGPYVWIPDYDVPKCGGWHVGRIGVG